VSGFFKWKQIYAVVLIMHICIASID